jgi:hypothetical protein
LIDANQQAASKLPHQRRAVIFFSTITFKINNRHLPLEEKSFLLSETSNRLRGTHIKIIFPAADVIFQLPN